MHAIRVGRPLCATTCVKAAMIALAAAAAAAEQERQGADLATVVIVETAAPPAWALWERQLLAQLYPAAIEFVQKYTRSDGTLIWRDQWPGMDGSDDGYESFYNFPLYYALGGPAELDALSRRLWEAVTRQFTQYGQVHHEFDGYYDWMHHGEAYTNFYFFGLADPTNAVFRERSLRFAGLYLGEDPEAPNYDPERKLIRSPITGSRGPRFVNSAEDWVTHREVLADYLLPYTDIPHVATSDAWVDDARFPFILDAMNQRMMRSDVPLNLTATSLVLNAFMYQGDAKYREWIEAYVSAWMDRVQTNGGVLPDNVGPSGKIGEHMDGKWWGGYYGWRWPHGLFNQIEATLIGGTNAYLISGDPKYLQLPRSVLDVVQQHRRIEGGQAVVPHRYDDRGWHDYRPISPAHLVYLWHVSQDPDDLQRIRTLTEGVPRDTLSYRKSKGDWEHALAWLGFIEGRNPEYPEQILRATYAESLQRLQVIRQDTSDPATRNVHHWQERNPVVLEGLVQLMLGGPNHIYHGGLLHSRLLYFDPQRRRPGVPADVAALVDRVTPDGLSVQLVNLHSTQWRELIVQAGAFGEHDFSTVEHQSQSIEVNRNRIHVRLAPGACGRLDITMRRYVHAPSYLH
ncbi:MAG: hypothetical protein MUF48_17090 [Pirellulaceae bacterium]|jgi:hypothetical protein|nr:hypothetical protein [Pirellulaceae bacterium]